MRNVWRFSFRFVVHIAVLFGFLVLTTALGIIWVSDRGADRLLEVNGSAIAERTAQFIGSELEAILAPVEVAVSIAGASSEAQRFQCTGARQSRTREPSQGASSRGRRAAGSPPMLAGAAP
ncbi:MAG: hypothetical protein ACOVVK_14965, partial [Elsteraceae bacterium]